MHRARVSQSVNVVYSLAGGSDYQEISAAALEIFLTFDDANRRQSFDVIILDDSSIEDTESFSLELRFDPFDILPPSNVVLSPNVSVVTILDDDEPGMKTIKYNHSYCYRLLIITMSSPILRLVHLGACA